MLKKITAGALLAVSGFSFNAQGSIPMDPWAEGELEYHIICTGRGESNFLIMPDGTSMLIDAGDWNDLWDEMAPAMPDERYRAGEYIKRYIQKVNPHGNNVDYLVISHFHNDHYGDTTVRGLPKSDNGKESYVICGVTEVGQEIRFGKEFDRGYPDYDYPKKVNDPDVDNMRLWMKKMNRDYGMVQEKFLSGRGDQIVPLHEDIKIDAPFEVRNLSSSGEVWTGKGDETVRWYDQNKDNVKGGLNENTNSIALRISYGPFALFTGGDISGSLKSKEGGYVNIENLAGKACGPVDVCKLNHHGYRHTTSPEFVASVDAANYLIPAWDYWHIQPTVMTNIMNGGRFDGKTPMVFPTHVFYNHRKEYGNEEWFKLISPEWGHVVVKVAPGGETYRIYVLDATDEEMNVKAIYGPYESGRHKS